MLYGERLLQAMQKRSATLGRDITRKDVAKVADTSVQNIGMIITNSKGTDQKLRTEAHERVASYLKVNSRWLLTGDGEMEQASAINAPSELTPAAIEIAVLFDMIPASDKLSRAKAFNAASTAIMQVLQDAASKP
ncbi:MULTISPECIES: hypothetical protein [Delftia]|uniref:hypothetical protein n=1 Tax=Delftia TaxID=80865 RepID=UPI0006406BAB|nr:MULTISPECIES: hypothetical protein [Delftia]MCO5338584.1 hypothetical protein [Delftia tsuruhatensis]MCR4546632.1 hypothetical protein [Delftia tsuruhatensis]MDH1461837.1 hypothetical protein [Delftia tsuruhatensis]WGG09984.1 hypothetical protein N5O86_25570 [Delftia tsuruhatensis]